MSSSAQPGSSASTTAASSSAPSPFLSHLGLSFPFSLTDDDLERLLTPLSVGWYMLGPAAHITSTPIPFDSILPLLHRLDDVLTRHCRHHCLKLHEDIERDNTETQLQRTSRLSRQHRDHNKLLATFSAPPAHTPSIDTSSLPPPSESLVLVVCRFSATLVSHASKVQLYPSMPRLLALLNSDSAAVVTAALFALIQFQHSSARMYAFSAFTERYKLRIKAYLIFFAIGLNARTQRHTLLTGSGSEEVVGEEEKRAVDVTEQLADDTELLQMCVERSEQGLTSEAQQLHFAFTSNYSFRRTATPPPTFPPSSSPSLSSSSSAPPLPAFPAVLSLSFASELYANYASVYGWTSVPSFVLWLSSYYSISAAHVFPLCHLLRFTSSYSSLPARRSYCVIRVLTYQLLMSFSTMRKELLHFFMYVSPTLLDDLLALVREERRVPMEIRTQAWLSLTQFSSASTVRSELKQLGLIQQSVLLTCLRNATQQAKYHANAVAAARALQSPDLPQLQDAAAATCAYAESILAFIERLTPRGLYEVPAISPVELVELMLDILADADITHCALFMRASAVIEGVINSAQSQQVISRFHAVNGLDTCLQRLAAIIHFTSTPPSSSVFSSSSSSFSPAASFRPLFVAAPSLDAALGHNKSLVPASYLTVRVVLEKLLMTCITAVRAHRQPVRLQLLKDGQLSKLLIYLWHTSIPPASDTETDSEMKVETSAVNDAPQPTEEREAETASSPTKKRRTSRTLSSVVQSTPSAPPSSDSAVSLSSSLTPPPSSPPGYFLHSRGFHWGPEIFGHTCSLFCALVQNNPSALKQLHTEGVTPALLTVLEQHTSTSTTVLADGAIPSTSFAHSFVFHPAILRVLPETLRSICLSHPGLEAVQQFNTLRSLYMIFLSSHPQHVQLLDRQTVYFLAKALEELLRHYKVLLVPAMKELVNILQQLQLQGTALAEQLEDAWRRTRRTEQSTDAATAAAGGSGGSGGRSAEAAESWVSFTHRLVNVGRFAEFMVKYFSSEFNRHGGAVALISLAELRNSRPALCGLYDVSASQLDSGGALSSNSVASSGSQAAYYVVHAAVHSSVQLGESKEDTSADGSKDKADKADHRYNSVQFVGLMNPLLLLAAKEPQSVIPLVMHAFHLHLDKLTSSAYYQSHAFLVPPSEAEEERIEPEEGQQQGGVSLSSGGRRQSRSLLSMAASPLTVSPFFPIFSSDATSTSVVSSASSPSAPSSSLYSSSSSSSSLAECLCLLQCVDWCSMALSRLTRRSSAAAFATNEFGRDLNKLIEVQQKAHCMQALYFYQQKELTRRRQRAATHPLNPTSTHPTSSSISSSTSASVLLSSSEPTVPVRVYHGCVCRFMYHTVKLTQTLIKLTKANKPATSTLSSAQPRNIHAEQLTQHISKAVRVLLTHLPQPPPSHASYTPPDSPTDSPLPRWFTSVKYLRGVIRLFRLSFFSGSSHELNVELFLVCRRDGVGERLLNVMHWAVQLRVQVGEMVYEKRQREGEKAVDEERRREDVLDELELLVQLLDDVLNELASLTDSLSRYESLPEAPAASSPSSSSATSSARHVLHPAVRALLGPSAESAATSAAASSLTSPSNAVVAGSQELAAASAHVLNTTSEMISARMHEETGLPLQSTPSAAGPSHSHSTIIHLVSSNPDSAGNTVLQVSPTIMRFDDPAARGRRPAGSPRLSPLPHYSPNTTVASVRAADRIEEFDLSGPHASSHSKPAVDSEPSKVEKAEIDTASPAHDVGTEKLSQLLARECWRPMPGHSDTLLIPHCLSFMPINFSTLMLNVAYRWLNKARRDELRAEAAARSEDRRRQKQEANKVDPAKLVVQRDALLAGDAQKPVSERVLSGLYPPSHVLRAMEVTGAPFADVLVAWLQSKEGKQNIQQWKLQQLADEQTKETGDSVPTAPAQYLVFGPNADLLSIVRTTLSSLVLLPASDLAALNPLVLPPMPQPTSTRISPATSLIHVLANLFSFFPAVCHEIPAQLQSATSSSSGSTGTGESLKVERVKVDEHRLTEAVEMDVKADEAVGEDKPQAQEPEDKRASAEAVWMRERVATLVVDTFADCVRRLAASAVPTSAADAAGLEQLVLQCHAMLLVHCTLVATDRRSLLIASTDLQKSLHLSVVATVTANERLLAYQAAHPNEGASMSGTKPTDRCNRSCQSLLCSALYTINYQLDAQTSQSITADELLPHLTLNTSITMADPLDLNPDQAASPAQQQKLQSLAAQPYRSYHTQQQLLDIALSLLPSPLVHEAAICALLQVMARLTRSRAMVERFLKRSGMEALMRVESGQHIVEEREKRDKQEADEKAKQKKRSERAAAAERGEVDGKEDEAEEEEEKKKEEPPIAPSASPLLYESSLATLLAHVLTPPSSLQQSMEDEIKTVLTDYQRQVSEQRKTSGDKRRALSFADKAMTLTQFVYLFSTMIRRDAAVFVRAVQKTCVIEQLSIEPADKPADRAGDSEKKEKESKDDSEAMSDASPPLARSASDSSTTSMASMTPRTHLCIRLAPTKRKASAAAEGKASKATKDQPKQDEHKELLSPSSARAPRAGASSTPALQRTNSSPSVSDSASASARKRRSRSRSRSQGRETAKDAQQTSSAAASREEAEKREGEWTAMEQMQRQHAHRFLDAIVIDLHRARLRLQNYRNKQQAADSTTAGGSQPNSAMSAADTTSGGSSQSDVADTNSAMSDSSVTPASDEQSVAVTTPARSKRKGKRRGKSTDSRKQPQPTSDSRQDRSGKQGNTSGKRKQHSQPQSAAHLAVPSPAKSAGRPSPPRPATMSLPPIAPLDPDFHPLLDHATCLAALQTGLESDTDAILPSVSSYDPRRCHGLSCSFPSLHELLLHALVLDPHHHFINTSIVCDFLMSHCAANLQMEEKQKQSEDEIKVVAHQVDAQLHKHDEEEKQERSGTGAPPPAARHIHFTPATSSSSRTPAMNTTAAPPSAAGGSPASAKSADKRHKPASEAESRAAVPASSAGYDRRMIDSFLRAITATIVVLITTHSQPLSADAWYNYNKQGQLQQSPPPSTSASSIWQAVQIPRRVRAEQLMRHVESNKAAQAAMLSATTNAPSAPIARQVANGVLSSLLTLSSMLTTLLGKSSGDSLTNSHGRKRIATSLLQCGAPTVLAAVLQWLDMAPHQSTRISLMLISATAKAINQLANMVELFDLTTSRRRKNGAGRRRGSKRAGAYRLNRLVAHSTINGGWDLNRELQQAQEEALEGEEDAVVEDVELTGREGFAVMDDEDDDELDDDDEDDEDDDEDDEEHLGDEQADVDEMGVGDVITVADDENEEEDEDDMYSDEDDDDDEEEGDVSGVFDDENDDEDDDGGLEVDDDDDNSDEAELDALMGEESEGESEQSDSEAEAEEKEAAVAAMAEDNQQLHEQLRRPNEEDNDDPEQPHQQSDEGGVGDDDIVIEADDQGEEGDDYGAYDEEEDEEGDEDDEGEGDELVEDDEDEDGSPVVEVDFDRLLDDSLLLNEWDDEEEDEEELAEDADADADVAHDNRELADVIEVTREEADRISDDFNTQLGMFGHDVRSGHQVLDERWPDGAAAGGEAAASQRPPSRRAYRVVSGGESQQQPPHDESHPQSSEADASTAAAGNPPSMRLRRSNALLDIHAAVNNVSQRRVRPSNGRPPQHAAAAATDSSQPEGSSAPAAPAAASASSSSNPRADALIDRLGSAMSELAAAEERLIGQRAHRSGAFSSALSTNPPTGSFEPPPRAVNDEVEQLRERYIRSAMARNEQMQQQSHRHQLSADERHALNAIERQVRRGEAQHAAASGQAAQAGGSNSVSRAQYRGASFRPRSANHPAQVGMFNPAALRQHAHHAAAALVPRGMTAAQLTSMLTQVANIGISFRHRVAAAGVPVNPSSAASSASRRAHRGQPARRGAASVPPMYGAPRIVFAQSPSDVDGFDYDDHAMDEDGLGNSGGGGVLVDEEDDMMDADGSVAAYSGDAAAGADGDDRSEGSDEGEDNNNNSSSSHNNGGNNRRRLGRWNGVIHIAGQPVEGAVGPAISIVVPGGRRPSQLPTAHRSNPVSVSGQVARRPSNPPRSAASSSSHSSRSAILSNMRGDLDAGWLEFDPLGSSPRHSIAAQHAVVLEPYTFALVHNTLLRTMPHSNTVHVKVRRCTSTPVSHSENSKEEAKQSGEEKEAESNVGSEEVARTVSYVSSSSSADDTGATTTSESAATPSVPSSSTSLSVPAPDGMQNSATAPATANTAALSAPTSEADDESEEQQLQRAIAMSTALMRTSSDQTAQSTSATSSTVASATTSNPDATSAATSLSASADSSSAMDLSTSASSSSASSSSSSSSQLAAGAVSPPPPAQLDAAVLAELPIDLRVEVLQQYNRELSQWSAQVTRIRAQRDPSNAAAITAASPGPLNNPSAFLSLSSPQPPAGVDEDFLAALPPELRDEVLLQHSTDQEALSLSAIRQRANERGMDIPTWLLTLPSEVREDALLSLDDDSLFSLPPAVLAEALALRNRHTGSHVVVHSRSNAPRQTARRSSAAVSAMNAASADVGGTNEQQRADEVQSPSSADNAQSVSSPASVSAADAHSAPAHGSFPRVDFNSISGRRALHQHQSGNESTNQPSQPPGRDAADAAVSPVLRRLASSPGPFAAVSSPTSTSLVATTHSSTVMDLSQFSATDEIFAQRTEPSLLPTPLLAPVVRVLYIQPISEQQILAIHRLALHVISSEYSRHTFLNLLQGILRCSYLCHLTPQSATLRTLELMRAVHPEVANMLAALPASLIGTPEETQLAVTADNWGADNGENRLTAQDAARSTSAVPASPPPVVVLRLIDLLRFLISKMPYLVTVFFFRISAASSLALKAAADTQQPPVEEVAMEEGDADEKAENRTHKSTASKAGKGAKRKSRGDSDVSSTPATSSPAPPSPASTSSRRRGRKNRRGQQPRTDRDEAAAAHATPPSKKQKNGQQHPTDLTTPSTLRTQAYTPPPSAITPYSARSASSNTLNFDSTVKRSSSGVWIPTLEAAPFSVSTFGSPLLELFAMFSAPSIVASARCVYYITRVLADLMELPCKHIAEIQAYRARKEKRRQTLEREKEGKEREEKGKETKEKDEKDDEQAEQVSERKDKEEKTGVSSDDSSLLSRDAHLDLPYPPLPFLPVWTVRAFLATITADGYSERCMELAFKVLLMMAERVDNYELILREVARMVVRLSEAIEADMNEIISLEKERARERTQTAIQQKALRSSSSPATADSQKKRKRGSHTAAAGATPVPAGTSSSATASTAAPSSRLWQLTIREAALLRFIRVLNTLTLVEAPAASTSSSSPSPPSPSASAAQANATAHASSVIKLPISAPAPTALSVARVELGKVVLAELGMNAQLRSLWHTMDRFLAMLEDKDTTNAAQYLTLHNTNAPNTPARSAAGQSKDEKAESDKKQSEDGTDEKMAVDSESKDAATASKASELLSKKVQDTRHDLTEEGGGSGSEVKESDLLLMMHLPLLECFFIVCAPRVSELPTGANLGRSVSTSLNVSSMQTPVAGTPVRTPTRAKVAAEALAASATAPSAVTASPAAAPSSSPPAPSRLSPTGLHVNIALSSSVPSTSGLDSTFYYEFSSRHRRVLNVCCRQQPALLKSGTGAFHSLVWHPGKILDFDIRRKYFKSEMKKLLARQRQHNPHSSMSALRVIVRRDTLFEDSYCQLMLHPIADWKNKLHVKFYDEEGLDAGGLSREWFLLLSREIFNPQYALFKPAVSNPAVFQPNKFSYWNPDHLQYFKFVGRFVGKALHDGHRLDAYFTRSMYKHMLGVSPTFHDLESIDPQYYNNLVWMLNNQIDGVLDDLTFSTESDEFGRQETVDLVPNGRNVAVTDENKVEYVDCMADFILTRSIQRQIDAFLSGFREMIPSSLLIFNENELELLLCGLPDIDLHDLQNNIEYRGYKQSDQTVQWFWQIAYEMTQQEKALLMLFVTGTSKIPLEGFKALQGANGVNPFTIQKGEGTDALPISHTCLTGDHAVLTRSGWRSIKCIVAGDMVASIHVGSRPDGEEVEDATYELQWKRVTNAQSHVFRPNAEHHRLFRMQGAAMDVIATRDHRMLLARVAGSKQTGRHSVSYETVGQLLDLDLTWATATASSHLQYTTDRAVLRSGINSQPAFKLVIRGMEATCDSWWQKDQQLGFLRFVGFWLADGSLLVHEGYVAIEQRQLESGSWLVDLLDEVFPRWWLRYRTAAYADGSTYRYVIHCPPLYEWLREMAAGPAGYNPMDATARRCYPHFEYATDVAELESGSPYGRPRTAEHLWTETEMLDAFAWRRSAEVDNITCTHPICVNMACDDDWRCSRCIDEDDRQSCMVCYSSHGTEDNELLFCNGEGCVRCCHVQCAGLTAVPEGDWVCAACKFIAEEVEAEEEMTASVVAVAGAQTVRRPVWNNGVVDIDIDDHWFDRKRWMGGDVADTFAHLCQQQATVLLEGFCRADRTYAHIHFNKKTGAPAGVWKCTNPSRPLIDHLQLIGQLAGAAVNLSQHIAEYQTSSTGDRQVTSKVGHWYLSFNFTSHPGHLQSTPLF